MCSLANLMRVLWVKRTFVRWKTRIHCKQILKKGEPNQPTCVIRHKFTNELEDSWTSPLLFYITQRLPPGIDGSNENESNLTSLASFFINSYTIFCSVPFLVSSRWRVITQLTQIKTTTIRPPKHIKVYVMIAWGAADASRVIVKRVSGGVRWNGK